MVAARTYTREKLPERLMRMLNYATEEEARTGKPSVIAWLPDGNSFIIRDIDEFQKTLLVDFFEGKSKFKNFVRNLYRWGFHQTKRRVFAGRIDRDVHASGSTTKSTSSTTSSSSENLTTSTSSNSSTSKSASCEIEDDKWMVFGNSEFTRGTTNFDHMSSDAGFRRAAALRSSRSTLSLPFPRIASNASSTSSSFNLHHDNGLATSANANSTASHNSANSLLRVVTLPSVIDYTNASSAAEMFNTSNATSTGAFRSSPSPTEALKATSLPDLSMLMLLQQSCSTNHQSSVNSSDHNRTNTASCSTVNNSPTNSLALLRAVQQHQQEERRKEVAATLSAALSTNNALSAALAAAARNGGNSNSSHTQSILTNMLLSQSAAGNVAYPSALNHHQQQDRQQQVQVQELQQQRQQQQQLQLLEQLQQSRYNNTSPPTTTSSSSSSAADKGLLNRLAFLQSIQ